MCEGREDVIQRQKQATIFFHNRIHRNSCYRGCSHGQRLLGLHLRADEA